MVCISHEEATRRGLSITALPADFPRVLHADGAATEDSLGLVTVNLAVPGNRSVLTVPMVVRRRLFCPLLMGRNMMEAINHAMGHQCLWDELGRGVNLVPKTRPARRSSKSVQSPKCATIKRRLGRRGRCMDRRHSTRIRRTKAVDSGGIFSPTAAPEDPLFLLGIRGASGWWTGRARERTSADRESCLPSRSGTLEQTPRASCWTRTSCWAIYSGRTVVGALAGGPSDTALLEDCAGADVSSAHAWISGRAQRSTAGDRCFSLRRIFRRRRFGSDALRRELAPNTVP